MNYPGEDVMTGARGDIMWMDGVKIVGGVVQPDEEPGESEMLSRKLYVAGQEARLGNRHEEAQDE